MIHQTRKSRTKPEDIVYAVHHLYFLSLSLIRNTSKALSRFVKRRSHTAIRYWIQKYKPEGLFYKKIKVAEEEFIVDETQIKVSEFRTTGFG
jgi:transposase-like protein